MIPLQNAFFRNKQSRCHCYNFACENESKDSTKGISISNMKARKKNEFDIFPNPNPNSNYLFHLKRHQLVIYLPVVISVNIRLTFFQFGKKPVISLRIRPISMLNLRPVAMCEELFAESRCWGRKSSLLRVFELWKNNNNNKVLDGLHYKKCWVSLTVIKES